MYRKESTNLKCVWLQFRGYVTVTSVPSGKVSELAEVGRKLECRSFVGQADGIVDDHPLGWELCQKLGFTLGLFDGCADDCKLGPHVGWAIGMLSGLWLGLAVGPLLGCTLGTTEGRLDGHTLGVVGDWDNG